MRPTDPRIRANLNRLTTTLDTLSTTTQSHLYTAYQRTAPLLTPCLESLSTCLEASCQPCFSARDEHFRGRRHRTGGGARGRGGRDGGVGGIGGFDFYDDWEQGLEDEGGGWGNDELERLLSGEGEEGEQPRRKGGMGYGSRLGGGGGGGGKRRGGGGGGGDEPNVVPQSSMFGFLESLPWKIGGRGSGRFRPGVADLQEGVGRKGGGGGGGGGGNFSENEGDGERRKGRVRSGTVESRSTTNSLSSRGDLFPSDDEADAVPLDDEFAMVLERRGTATSDEHSSGKRSGNRPAGSTKSSTKTGSSKETRNMKRKGKRGSSASSKKVGGFDETAEQEEVPSVTDLKGAEDRVKREEETLVEDRRKAAQKVARERGLADSERETEDFVEDQDSKEASIVESAELEPTSFADQNPPSSPEPENHNQNYEPRNDTSPERRPQKRGS